MFSVCSHVSLELTSEISTPKPDEFGNSCINDSSRHPLPDPSSRMRMCSLLLSANKEIAASINFEEKKVIELKEIRIKVFTVSVLGRGISVS
jgi:hypothetical protein